MMNFTSSVSDLEALLLKFNASFDYSNALKVANMLDIAYARDADSVDRSGFYVLHMALHLLENDVEGARYLWKRAPNGLKADSDSELSKLWSVGKMVYTGEVSEALAALEGRGSDAWDTLDGTLLRELVTRLRDAQWTSLLSSFDVITAFSASNMLHLSADDCKAELLAKGCVFDGEKDCFVIPAGLQQNNQPLDNGTLLRTLTDCVAKLERQPLSVNIKGEVEKAHARHLADKEKMELLS